MENQRVRITKNMLRDALVELLQKKSVHKISVTELCHCAQINRVTFYKYYGCPYDVLTDIEENLISQMADFTADYDQSSSHLIRVLELLMRHQNEMLVLLCNIPGNELEDKLFNLTVVKDILSQQNWAGYSEKEKENAYLFICSGSYSIIRRWLLNGCKDSPGDVANFIHSFAMKLLSPGDC